MHFVYQYIESFVFFKIGRRGAITPIAPLNPPLDLMDYSVTDQDMKGVLYLTGYLGSLSLQRSIDAIANCYSFYGQQDIMY